MQSIFGDVTSHDYESRIWAPATQEVRRKLWCCRKVGSVWCWLTRDPVSVAVWLWRVISEKGKKKNQCDLITVDLFRLSLGIINAINQVRNKRSGWVRVSRARWGCLPDDNQVHLIWKTRSIFNKSVNTHGVYVHIQFWPKEIILCLQSRLITTTTVTH